MFFLYLQQLNVTINYIRMQQNFHPYENKFIY
jgi:hypothetical protein